MHIPRWRNVFLLKSSLVPPFLYSKATATVATTHVASFHSSPITCEKWKSKWDFEERRTQQPTKNHISALKSLLYNSGCSNVSFQDEVQTWKFDGAEGWDSDGSDKKWWSRYSGRHAGKSNCKKVKRKFKRESFSDDFDHPERIFQAKFGNKWYTWSSGGDKSFKNPESGFEWREKSGWTNQRTKEEILGLPRAGPIKIEDVQNANFCVSAMKWHPDKHQGPSQEIAEEKFKMCVEAYKSLCHALS
ncbi:hypothetical protein ES288_A11G252800v1 [Gossypium darwinii]|uniref:J domain-containing protein n=2 Tax=Gossypium TaxID=3633 RepID=A0A5D2NGA2_GOSTO|nr:hypothetical protein ES288_A11G252800v1 [Gossypium darwinii]TYI02145.1 hypothetical protein ES332_A11G250500v1 [Gossypium tomentosum]